MQMSSATTYTNVTQAQYDAFRYQARAKGLNIAGNAETVEFDRVPVEFKYNPDTQILEVSVAEPHWLTPGVTIGVIHTLLATAMLNKDAVNDTAEARYLRAKMPQGIAPAPVVGSVDPKAPQPILTGFHVVPATLPKPVVGTAYSQTLKAEGGVAPYSFAVTGGKLQSGLTLGSTGVISGTPTGVTPTDTCTITATDSSKPAQTATFVV